MGVFMFFELYKCYQNAQRITYFFTTWLCRKASKTSETLKDRLQIYLLILTDLFPNAPFLYSLKTSENLKVVV